MGDSYGHGSGTDHGMTAPEARLAEETGAPVPRGGRRIAFTVASAILAAGAAGGLLGFALVTGWFDNEDGGIHRVHYLDFGILYGLILTSAAVALTWRPERKSSVFFQVVATAVAAILGGLVSADGSYLTLGLFVLAAAAILLALHPARGGVLRPSMRASPFMGALALAGSVPLVWFALTVARLQRAGPPIDPHVSGDHWANMAAMAFGLVLVGLLASARMPGWRITAWSAGLGAAVYGLASIVFHRFPGSSVPYPGSEGIAWGLVAMIGGLAFVAAAEWESARQRPTA
jgi:hypothetical protein